MKQLATLCIMLCAGALSANCLTPRDYKGEVSLHAQQVVIVHRAGTDSSPGYQEMLIRLLPRFDDGGSAPAEMIWVITLPGKALRYELADKAALQAGPGLHERLFQIAREQWSDRSQFGWPSWLPSNMTERPMEDARDIVIEEPEVQVGPYEITPVRSTGEQALEELNLYLQQRGYPQLAPDDAGYFTEQQFTFLCVRVSPGPGRVDLAGPVDLPPLVLGFETDKLYLPLRFSAGLGDFALDLTLISDKPLDTESVAGNRGRLKAVSRGYVQLVNLYTLKPLPETLSAALGERAKGDDPAHWYVNRIQSQGVNPREDHGRPNLQSFDEDVFFTVGTTRDELPGFWYYADQEIPFLERMFREHAMAIFFGGGLLFFATLFIKTRINRKRMQQQAKATE